MVIEQVALFRGINVGRAKRVAMADLRALLESLGYADVRTLLNSGNAVFSVPRAVKGNPAGRIEAALSTRLGVAARVTLLSAAELTAIVAGNPLLDVADDPARLLVSVLADPADRGRLRALPKSGADGGSLAVGGRAVYVWCPEGTLASPLLAAVGKALGDRVTSRNWATVLKIHALLRDGG